MADSDRIEALIALGIDEAKAAAAIKIVDAMGGSLRGVQRESDATVKKLHEVARTGEKLRSVGTVMAGLGASILGPLALAANEYATRYKSLEPAANRFNAALERQRNATSALGREAASALTPVMNQAAAFTEKLSAFAAAHPDVMRAAITGGALLTAGGAGLIAAGTAIASLSKGLEVIKSLGGTGAGGVLGGLAKAGVGIGALAVGAEAAVAGLNKIGEATNNEYLQQYQLSDALKTGREILGAAILGIAQKFIEAKKTWGELQDTIEAVWTVVKTKFESVMDSFGTGIAKALTLFRGGIAEFINGILETVATIANQVGANDLAQSLRKAKDPRASRGDRTDHKTDYEVEAEGYDAGFNKREASRKDSLTGTYDPTTGQFGGGLAQHLAANAATREKQYQTDMANLADFAKNVVAPFAQSGSLGPLLDGVLKPVIDKVGGLLGGVGKLFSGGGGGTGPASGTASPELTNAYIQRLKAQTAADRQYANDRRDLQAKYNDDELKARKAHDRDLLKLSNEQAKAETELIARQGVDRQKIIADYNASEHEITQRGEFDREQRFKAHQSRLKQIEDTLDVEAYLQEQDSYKATEEAQSDQDNFEREQRADKFTAQLKEQGDQNRTELDTLRQQGRDKKDELNAQFNTEEQDRQTAYDDQLAALRQHHIDQKTEIDRAFVEQIAALEGNYAGLKTLHDNYYADMSKKALDFVNTNKGYLSSLYDSKPGSIQSSPASGYSGGAPASAAYLSPSQTAHVAGDAQIYNTTSKPINVTIHASVGDHVTQTHLDQLAAQFRGAIRATAT